MESKRFTLGNITGLDRKAMEEERLARQAGRRIKRERSISPPTRGSRKAPKLGETTIKMDSGAMLKSFTSIVQQDQQARKSDAANAAITRMKKEPSPSSQKIKAEPSDYTGVNPESLPQGSLKYPNGVVKKTWAFGHERDGSDIKLEEVLEPNSVNIAVLSAFQWDDQWVLSKLKTPLNGGKTKVIFVMQAKDPEYRAQVLEEMKKANNFLKVCFPPMSGLIWCMHSKLMLLFHPNKLRIAVPTANLLNFDWGETGQMENSVFMIDLPRLAEGSKNTVEGLTAFGKELMFFTKKQGMDENVQEGLLNFDFTATADMAFVHTIGGVHSGENAQRTGLLGLGRAVQDLDLTTSPGDIEIDFAASSIGQLNEKYLTDLHSAAQGINLYEQAHQAKVKAATNFFASKASARGNSSLSSSSSVTEKFRIYFPTQETVRSSTAGAAGTICLQRNYFESKTFPKQCFRDYKSTRTGLLSHNKILCARGKAEGSKKPVSWVYVGSANMSKSAWGELPADRTKGERKITCRNWECGVLLPVTRPEPGRMTERGKEGHVDSETESEGVNEAVKEEEEEEDEADEALDTMEAFKRVIDLPFQVPGEEYAGREPWYFKEQ